MCLHCVSVIQVFINTWVINNNKRKGVSMSAHAHLEEGTYSVSTGKGNQG